MGIEVIFTLLSGVVSILGAFAASSESMQKLIKSATGISIKNEKNYSERLSELTQSLRKSSQEVDGILVELSHVAIEREKAVRKIEIDLAKLETQEKELKEKVSFLEKAPLPVAEHFAKIIQSGERRSARRDYVLFGAGVVVSTAISITLQLFF